MERNNLIRNIIVAAFFLFTFISPGQYAIGAEPEVKTVKIGSQVWMLENLNTSTFRNGDPIAEAKTNAEWIKAGEEGRPAWCYSGNDQNNGVKYGKLYNWFAANDPRGLAPKGWHIPTYDEWAILINYLGEDSNRKLKSKLGWNSDCYEATNESGFTGLPGGSRKDGRFDGDASFWGIGFTSPFWSSTEYSYCAWIIDLSCDRGVWMGHDNSKMCGISVRCIKD